jgi:WD40 repeat protein
LRLWDIAARKPVWTVDTGAERGYGVTWSPDGQFLATCGSSPQVRIWKRADGKPTASLEAGRNIIAVRWRENRLVGADYDGGAAAWQHTSGRHDAAQWRAVDPPRRETAPKPISSDR